MLLPANWLFGAGARTCWAVAANVTSSSNNGIRIGSPKHFQLLRGSVPRIDYFQMIPKRTPSRTRLTFRIYVSSEATHGKYLHKQLIFLTIVPSLNYPRFRVAGRRAERRRSDTMATDRGVFPARRIIAQEPHRDLRPSVIGNVYENRKFIENRILQFGPGTGRLRPGDRWHNDWGGPRRCDPLN